MIGRRSTILDEADRWLFHVVLLVSVYVAFKGHNAPGGGFAGGLIAGCAFVLRFLAGGQLRVRRSTIVNPATLIGGGMLMAVCTAMTPLLFGDALLDSAIVNVDVPLWVLVALGADPAEIGPPPVSEPSETSR